MGNTHSTQEGVSLEQFKEQVFSQVVFFIAKYANHKLEFKDIDDCSPDFLPKIHNQDFESIINYYKNDHSNSDYCIEEYLSKHVLNSLENTTRFHKILMTKLSQDYEDLIEDKVEEDLTADLISVASNVQQFYKAYEGQSDNKSTKSNKSNKSSIVPSTVNTKSTHSIQSQKSNLSKPTNRSQSSIKSQKSKPTKKHYPSEATATPTEIYSVSQLEDEISADFDEDYQISENTIPESVWDKNLVSELKKEHAFESASVLSSEIPDKCLVSHL